MRLFRSMRVRRVWVPLLLAGAIALQPFTTTPASAVTSRERTLFHLLNRSRHRHGRAPLRLSASISRLARRHSVRMARARSLFHQCMSCILHNHHWRSIGENVGDAGSVRTMNTLFMNSPPHRENMLCGCFTRVGIGIVRWGGQLWVTEDFYRP